MRGMAQPTAARVSLVPEGRSDRDGMTDDVIGGGRDGNHQGVVNTGIKDGTNRPKRGGEKA